MREWICLWIFRLNASKQIRNREFIDYLTDIFSESHWNRIDWFELVKENRLLSTFWGKLGEINVIDPFSFECFMLWFFTGQSATNNFTLGIYFRTYWQKFATSCRKNRTVDLHLYINLCMILLKGNESAHNANSYKFTHTQNYEGGNI